MNIYIGTVVFASITSLTTTTTTTITRHRR